MTTQQSIIDELKPLAVPLESLQLDPNNARAHPDQNMDALRESLSRFGQRQVVVVQRTGNKVIAGNARVMAARDLGWSHIAAVVVDDDDPRAMAFALADNRTAELALWNIETLSGQLAFLEELDDPDLPVDQLGWSEAELMALLGTSEPGDEPTPGSMAATFGAPPVTLLDARQGYWQDRKRAWMAQGIASEAGRDSDLISGATERSGFGMDYDLSNGENAWGGSGTSIFDPVLAELMVRWFSPEGGTVLDPFAGGSVRGVVSALVGRHYTGIDLRAEQVDENRKQWSNIRAALPTAPTTQPTITDPAELTPIEKVGNLWIKRDDLFECNGVQGGKVRTCLALSQGASGLVTAGSRSSPQVNIVAHIADYLGVPCRVHTPAGAASPEVAQAVAYGAERISHRPGYNTVIVKRARDDAKAHGWTEIPFGMECQEAVKQTRKQVPEVLPDGVRRLVAPVGSGMSLSGILWGLKDHDHKLPVVGVVVGADPTERLDKYAPKGWRDMVELIEAKEDYHDEVNATIGSVVLDPVYEAKCVPHLEPGDLLWVVGVRATATAPTAAGSASWVTGDSAVVLADDRPTDGQAVDLELQSYDMVLSCPPYGDLEVYSDKPDDLSTMTHDQFLTAYRAIIAAAVARMAPDSFAAWVVGDYRDKRGIYRNFVGDTITAFLDAGASLYNEAVYVTPMGSLPLRAGRIFQAGRKLGKTHQNVLVFVKGDPKRAAARCGPVDLRLDDAEWSE